MPGAGPPWPWAVPGLPAVPASSSSLTQGLPPGIPRPHRVRLPPRAPESPSSSRRGLQDAVGHQKEATEIARRFSWLRRSVREALPHPRAAWSPPRPQEEGGPPDLITAVFLGSRTGPGTQEALGACCVEGTGTGPTLGRGRPRPREVKQRVRGRAARRKLSRDDLSVPSVPTLSAPRQGSPLWVLVSGGGGGAGARWCR